MTPKIEIKWNEKYQRLLAYKEQNGDCLVPPKYPADPELGHWVDMQRQRFRQKTLRNDRKVKLDQVGFVYEVPVEVKNRFQQKWEAQYQELVAFQRIHGHCRVPCQRKAKNTQYQTLSSWVAHQRARRFSTARKYRSLTQQEIEKLDVIGFIWKADYDERWEDKFKRLKRYKLEHGDCDVPQKYEEDKQLGNWANMQRKHYKDNHLKEERIAKLEEVGFKWLLGKPWEEDRDSTANDRKWEAKYRDLCEFHTSHGHCLVPAFYEEDTSLGDWVSIQRRKHKEGKLSEVQEERLNELGFVWEVDIYDPTTSQNQRDWDEMFERLVQFKDKYGHVRVPKSPDFEDHQLSNWVSTQRAFHRDGTLNSTRHERLQNIGFLWSAGTHKGRTLQEPESGTEGEHENEEEKPTTKRPLTESSIDLRVGDRVAVYWPDDDEYYHGTITQKTSSERIHIHYDDGDDEWLNPSVESIVKLAERGSDEKERPRKRSRKDSSDNLEVGDRISVYWPDDDDYYHGTITQKSSSERIHIHYDDGDDEWLNPSVESIVKLAERGSDEKERPRKRSRKDNSDNLEVGDRISVYWKDDNEYYPGTIVRKEPLDRIRVHYDDGDKEWLSPSSETVIKLDQRQASSDDKKRELSRIKVGDRLSVWWPAEHEYYDATVAKVNRSKVKPFFLEYDDGDREWTNLACREFKRID